MSSTIHFVDGGQLILGSTRFRGKIEGFTEPDTIDLLAIEFHSGTTTLGYQDNGLSGTLTVTDGVHTQKLAMIGSYMAANFTLMSDGHGGTLVSDPPVQSAVNIVSQH
jgi:hypothetical protein